MNKEPDFFQRYADKYLKGNRRITIVVFWGALIFPFLMLILTIKFLI